ncbi:MAG: ComEC/Rec2 family competence protein [Alicyclobacillaceae bacterium]|nr:ComEC/Rec2 family competence protein [Alicyclobacillaceae bacterium]
MRPEAGWFRRAFGQAAGRHRPWLLLAAWTAAIEGGYLAAGPLHSWLTGGSLLQIQPAVWAWAAVAAVGLVAAAAGAITVASPVVAAAASRRPLRGVRPAKRLHAWMVFVLSAAAAAGYGGCRGWTDAWADWPTGVPLVQQVTVESVYPSPQEWRVYVDRALRDGAGTRARIDIDPKHLGRPIRPGDRLRLTGVFVPVVRPAGGGRAGPAAGAAGSAIAGGLLPHRADVPRRQADGMPVYAFQGQVERLSSAPPGGFGAIRQWLDEAARRAGAGNAPDRRLLESVVFGGESLSPGTKDVFLRAGLLHVLAASGANALILSCALEWTAGRAARRLRVPSSVWTMVKLAALWGFAGLCSFSVSIVRAVCMITYASLASICRRPSSSATAIAYAALAVAVWQPALWLTVSAWLYSQPRWRLRRPLERPRRSAAADRVYQAAPNQANEIYTI